MSNDTPINIPDIGVLLSEDFGDATSLFNIRKWLQSAVESKGAKITGAGMGCGGADLDIILEGFNYTLTIKPIIRS